ncbi:MAG: cytochrome P450 [Acidobacteria bacterium]|nr:cytochrome P450 [Acidobacteriota bacterium]
MYKTERVAGFRQFVAFRRDRLDYLAEAARRGLDVREVKLFTAKGHLYQINHPQLIEDILITNDWNFVKGKALASSKVVLGEGLITSEGELHRRQRRLVQPAFHSQRLVGYAESMTRCALDRRDSWRAGHVVDIHEEMMRLTLIIVGETLFSADLRGQSDEVGGALKRALAMFLRLNSPLAQFVGPFRRRAMRIAADARKDIVRVLHRIIEEHRAQPERYNDMLSMLMEAQDPNSPQHMSDELLLDESLTLFLAGHETVANALTWTMYLLSQNPDAEEKLVAELQSVLNGRTPALDDLPRLTYTTQCLKEALRIYPPVWVIVRDTVTAYRVADMDIPAHTLLLLSTFATHRDARWWPDPLRYNPDRFASDAPPRPRFAFYPFGAGTRHCIGESFATTESVLLLATILQRWKLSFLPHQKVELWPQITLRPKHPMRFRVEPR